MNSLAEENFVSLQGNETSLTEAEIAGLKPEVPKWEVREKDGVKRLRRTFKFEDFIEALDFTNQVGEMAEEQDHHPKLVTEWGRVTVTWWTHKIGGLHRNDFIMAARTDDLYEVE